MDLPKQGFRQFFCVCAFGALKCMPRPEEEYSEGEMSFVVISELLYIIWWHWFRVLVKQKIHLENGTTVQVLKPVIKGHLEMPTTCCSCAQTLIRWHGSIPWIYVYLSMVLFFLGGNHMYKAYICQNEKTHNGHQRWTCLSMKMTVLVINVWDPFSPNQDEFEETERLFSS